MGKIVAKNHITLLDQYGKPMSRSRKSALNYLNGPLDSNPYSGAETNRLMADLPLGDYTARRSIQKAIGTLRARARHLERNNDIVRRALYLIEQNVIGPQGIRLMSQARRTDTGEAKDRTAIALIEQSWNKMGRECDIRKRFGSFRQLSKMIERRAIVDGETFIELLPGYDNDCRYSLRMIDPIHVPTGLYNPEERIFMGIQYDVDWVPVSYLVADENGDREVIGAAGVSRFRNVPADRMIHYFHPERPNQGRGVTMIASPMQRLHMLDQYEEATLVGARIASSKMGFFYDEIADTMPTRYRGGEDDEVGEIRDSETGQPYDEDNEVDIEPGTFEDIGKKRFASFDPGYPPARYEEYTRSILRSISSGLNISYFKLSNDLSDVNYSTAREAKLDDVDAWRDHQQNFIDCVLDPLFESWLSVQLLTPAFNRYSINDYRRLSHHHWQPRGWKWIDPDKESKAALREVQMGLKSPTQIAQENGIDFRQTVDQIAEDLAYAKSKGVDVTSILYTGGTNEQAPPQQSEPAEES